MREHRRIAAEAAHGFGRQHDFVIVGGGKAPNGRAIKDHPFGAERSRGAASPTGEEKAMIGIEGLDRLAPAPGDLMISQVQWNARIERLRYEEVLT